jgi:PAS domain S-box-containing protein
VNDKHVILIIDDTPENLQVLGSLLDQRGYEVMIASSGFEAFQIIGSLLPDLILLDIMMPDMDGFEVCRKIKANPESGKIPVIFISALELVDQKVQAFKSGAVDYITKPFQADEVLARVETHLRLVQLEELKQEIAGRVLTEEKLRLSESRFRTLLNSIPELVWLKDPDGVYLACNRLFECFFGFSEKDIVGKTDYDFVDKELADSFRDNDRMALSVGGARSNQEWVTFADSGQRVFLKTTKVPLFDDSGSVIGVLGVSADITDLERNRKIMIQHEKMMMVGGIAAGVAHEINNPLSTIIQGIQNVERRFSPKLPSNKKVADEIGLDLNKVHVYMEQREINSYFDNMRKAADRASYIAANLLQFSRQGDKFHQMLDINEVLNQAIDLAASDSTLLRKYNFKGIDIKREYSRKLPKISLSITEIEMVIINLLKNAAQAMSAAGIEEPVITVRTSRLREHVAITIEDNGPGITDEVCQKVFDPFFTTKEPGHGTGLGLSVSHAIIADKHGGTIFVESEPGKGSCFTIHLPISDTGAVS